MPASALFISTVLLFSLVLVLLANYSEPKPIVLRTCPASQIAVRFRELGLRGFLWSSVEHGTALPAMTTPARPEKAKNSKIYHKQFDF